LRWSSTPASTGAPTCLSALGDPERKRLVNADDADLVLALIGAGARTASNHFLGDFAFAIWDARGKDCFVRAIISGSVHSFYALNETRFAFASVLNVVRRFPGVGDHLDDLAVA
jgi:asparagine synthase (glutamine-hydrolysing)